MIFINSVVAYGFLKLLYIGSGRNKLMKGPDDLGGGVWGGFSPIKIAQIYKLKHAFCAMRINKKHVYCLSLQS